MRLIDLHNDAVTKISHKRFLKYVKCAEKAGVQTIFVSVWTTEMQGPLQKIRETREFLDSINSNVQLPLHIEDAWFINEQNIDEVIKCKPYSVGLTWNTNNNLAGGANDDGNLTLLGKKIIEKLIKNDIVIDLAHLNRPSFFEVTKLLREKGQPLLCTHTCFDEVHSHPRNLNREQIKTIVNAGGLIGLTLVGKFLSPNKRATLHDVCKHIEYFIKNFGTDNIAIGTDFFGTDNLPRGLRKYKDFKRLEKFFDHTTIEEILRINYCDFRKINK